MSIVLYFNIFLAYRTKEMTKEEREKRLNEAIKHLIAIGMINGTSTTKNIAATMGRNSTNLSSAIRGDIRYLNRKFVRDFCATYKNIISEEWLWDGKGEMLVQAPAYNNQSHPITDESLMRLSREELVFLVKQLMTLHSEQTEMYRLLIRQNEEMIRNGQERLNNITKLIYKNI